MEGFDNPFPQLEEPGSAHDPGLKEDPDITVELVNETFYWASCDGALVAIIADYPGLLPASRVSKVETSSSKEDSFLTPCLMQKISFFIETTIGTRRRAPGGSSAKGVRVRQA